MNDVETFSDTADEPQKGAALERLQSVWRRRKWLAILAFAVPFTAVLVLILALPSIYRSTATVIVDRQQVPEAFVRSTVTSEIETRLQTISQEILSRSRLEGLIRRFGLYADLRKVMSSEEVIERMRRDIQLELRATEPKGRTGATIAFAVSYRGRDPQTVALVTNTLVSSYIEENLKARERQAAGTAEFLKVQLVQTKKRLDEQEKLVSDFRKRHVGELPQQMQSNMTTLEALNTQLRLNSDIRVRTAERRELLAAQIAEAASASELTASPAASDPEPNAVRLARFKRELTLARIRYTEEHPSLVRLKEAIAALERELQENPGAAESSPSRMPPSPYMLRLKEALQGAEVETKALKAEEVRLRTAIASYQARVENTPRREQEFLELSRDYEATRELYQSLMKRHEEAQLAESMEMRQKGEQFRVLDPAIPSAIPAAPNRARLLFFGLVLSLGLGAGAVMLAEVLDTSFHSFDDLRIFAKVPILASIPKIVTVVDRRRRRRRFGIAAAGAMLALALVGGTSYFVSHGNETLAQFLAGERA